MKKKMYAKLVGNRVVECDLDEWAKFFDNASNRRVAEDTVGAAYVSTVFLGMNHSFGEGPPLWFETMIFGGKNDEYQTRYSTWDQALAGHKAIVKALEAGEDL